MKEMKNLVGRVKHGHGETKIPGKVAQSSAADMSGTRVKKGPGLKRVDETDRKHGMMGFKVGSRVTSKDTGGKP